MLIQDISITSLRRSLDGRRVLGDVNFQIVDSDTPRSLRVSCDTPYSKRIRPDAVLIGDAIRQVRRLPAIKTGQARLTFARGLRPLSHRAGSVDRVPATG